MKVDELADSYQLSPMQQGMLFHGLYAQESGVDIEQMICTLHEDLQVSAFKQAWERVLERHPVLRTSFCWEGDSEPQQYVHRQVRLPLEQQDWRGLSAPEQKERLKTYLQTDRRRGFVLTEAPLMRLMLLQVSESDYQLIWTFHHILMDGRSLPIVLKEVFGFYDACCQGEDLQLQPPPSYRDHIQWQQQNLSSAQEFWRQSLKGFTAPTPLVVQAATADKHQGASTVVEQEIRLSEAATSTLQSLAQQHQLTLNTLVQGAWALLLWRYSGEADVVFGATRACRRSSVAGAESMVGLLINTVPVRVKMSPEMHLLPWLKALRTNWIDLRNYEHTPLVNIQGWSDLPGGTPLFDSIVVFENYQLNWMLRSQGGRWSNREFQLLEQTNYPLTLVGSADPELLLQLKYDPRRFDDRTMAYVLGHIQTLLESMAANPCQCLAELPLLTADERQMLVEWNDTQADFPKEACIHQLFEAQVARTPEAVAVVFTDEQLSYHQLNCWANQLAHHLRYLGVGPGVLVAIYLDRSLEMIPALLGILKAGGAYVPLETSWPKARIQSLLSSLQINCVITQSSQLLMLQELQQQLPTLEHLICLDSQSSESVNKVMSVPSGHWHIWTNLELKALPQENLPRLSSSNSIAYVIFTSGSTGTPKGVVVCHQSVVNLIDWVNTKFEINASDRVLFITSLSFDLSVYDVFGLLAAGGSIRVASNCEVHEPVHLLRLLGDEPITFWNSAPAALMQLVPLFPEINQQHQLRLVFLSGDWIPVQLPNLVKAAFPEVEVISLGGATEATVWSNYYAIADVEPQWASIPYGKPIQNAQYYILDFYLNPCPVGVPGQLYIGGEVLASGYFNQPELTAEKFIPNHFSNNLGARLYKTGDLASYMPDGNILFLGRIDHQVKIRGFRIELGEIEAVLSQHLQVQETVVIAQEDQFGDKRLVAYVVPQQPGLTLNELRRFLQEKLPQHLVPSAFIMLNTLPLTPNGKVDRRALPVPDPTRPELERAFVAPQEALELQLAQIWSKVLGIQPIGMRDNFFELGGHSLLAVRLFTQIEKIFGKNLPLSILFEAPTVEQLASMLRQQGISAPWSSLVAIQPSGSKRPLFCVHPAGGHVFCYLKLARYLGPEQPVYGLQAQGLDEKQAPLTRVEDMAAHYIKEIRNIQPDGPYLLAGYSFGGTIAFEMAQQLHAQGQKVAMLALLDAYSPTLKPNPSLTWSLWFSIYWRNLSQLELKEKWVYALMRVQDYTKTKFPNFYHSYLSSQRDLSEEFYSNLANAHLQIFKNYVPQVYSSHGTLFRTREQLPKFSYELQLGWGELVSGGLERYEIIGPHEALLREPYVQVLAEKLQACLNHAEAND